MNVIDESSVLDQVLPEWAKYKQVWGHPIERIRLWSEGGLGICLDNKFGPAVPYPSVEHLDGNKNHGYRSLKGSLGAIADVPEAQDWQEIRCLLQTINALSSPIESVGCEKGVFSNSVPGEPPILVGGYFDVVYTLAPRNEAPENLLLLAAKLAPFVQDCGRWWASISFVLQPFRALPGTSMPWGLMFHVQNFGRTTDEARRLFGESLKRLSEGIEELPLDLGC
jgi:hypothetical protein